MHIVYVTATNDAAGHSPANAGRGRAAEPAHVHRDVTSASAIERHFTNAVTEIAIGEGALDRTTIGCCSRTTTRFTSARRVCTPGARQLVLNSLSYIAGGGLARYDLGVLLAEAGCSATINGLYITSGDQHIDNMINIDHAAPHTTSRLYYKGILDDRSRAVFGGTVFVRKGADKTDAHQEDKNLLLSREAEVDSKPALEIYADDVKAGHGATAGAIADEALFYMRSRGLDEDTAMQFLVRGFAAEIIDTVTIDPLREWLEEHRRCRRCRASEARLWHDAGSSAAALAALRTGSSILRSRPD